MAKLRLMTYNVYSLRLDKAAVTRVIRAGDPHVVCIQEAPRFLAWRSKRAALARRSGLITGAGERNPANLILCAPSVTVLAQRMLRLNRRPDDTERHTRGAVFALMGFEQRRFAVVATHLDGEDQARPRQIRELHEALAAFVPPDVPSVIAGDMNALPDSDSWRMLTAQHVDAFAARGVGDGFTCPAATPTRRIDAVFVDPRLPICCAEVPGSNDVEVASDHRPVLVEIELP